MNNDLIPAELWPPQAVLRADVPFVSPVPSIRGPGLREVGLPLSAFWSFNRAGLAMQLRRTVEMAADQDVAMAIEDFPAGAEAK